MPEISEETKKTDKPFDSCVVEIPKEFALANGLSEKSLVSLSIRHGKLESEIIVYDDEDEKEVEDFLSDFPGYNEEMKKFGD